MSRSTSSQLKIIAEAYARIPSRVSDHMRNARKDVFFNDIVCSMWPKQGPKQWMAVHELERYYDAAWEKLQVWEKLSE